MHTRPSGVEREPPGDGFITDAEWLRDRLGRAQKRVASLEISLSAACERTDRWFEAECRLGFAREEVEAYEAYLRDLT